MIHRIAVAVLFVTLAVHIGLLFFDREYRDTAQCFHFNRPSACIAIGQPGLARW